jgi:nicotinate-nucleotide adenylyltransferase
MIGIYGGTFNPVHFGHLRTALEVKEIFGLEQLRLIPCRLPAHRQEPDVSAQMRLQMLNLAVADTPGLMVDRRELDRQGKSFMVDTLQSLAADFPGQSLLLIMGADAFAGLQSWHQWQRLFDYAHIAVLTRPGFTRQRLPEFFQQRQVENIAELKQQSAGLLIFQAVTLLDISSTKIRRMIAGGASPQFLLPQQVQTFIQQHQLYRVIES